jgi:hypothetical protein
MDFTTNPVFKFILNTVNHGLEYSAGRWYAIYQGKVAKLIDGFPGNVDARNQGKVFVNVHDLGFGQKVGVGDAATFESDDLPYPALPVSPYAGKDHGFYFPPEIGDSVWVSFELGNIEQPRYLGSWWGNAGTGPSSALSELPSEFRSTPGLPPMHRGIKTGFGHGLLFNDSPQTPSVRMWSGKSTELGQSATKKQILTLTDDPSDAGIGLDTFYGHYVDMNDTTKVITVSTKLGNSVILDDNKNTITIVTSNPGQSIVFDAKALSITVTSPGMTTINSVGPVSVASASTATITATGAASIAAAGGVSLASGTATPAAIPTPGMSVENGSGAKLINFAGAWTQTVGVMTVAAASLNLIAALMTLSGNIVITGNTIIGGLLAIGPGTQQGLMNQQLIDWLVSHTHSTIGPGGTPANAAALGTSAAPLPPYVTTSLTAS